MFFIQSENVESPCSVECKNPVSIHL
jgi:hypothetical protein